MPESPIPPGDHEPDDKHLTRRVFVASGIAAGAAVVWTSPFPFADSPIGQATDAQAATGTTGTTGPTGTTTTPTTTTPTTTTPKPKPTGGTGGTGTSTPVKHSALALGSSHILRMRKAGYVVVPIRAKGPKGLSGTVKLDRLVGGKRRTLGRAKFKLGVGQKKNVKVPLNKAARKSVTDHSKIGARMTVAAAGAPTRHKLVSIHAPGK
jgi:hypothetical protein